MTRFLPERIAVYESRTKSENFVPPEALTASASVRNLISFYEREQPTENGDLDANKTDHQLRDPDIQDEGGNMKTTTCDSEVSTEAPSKSVSVSVKKLINFYEGKFNMETLSNGYDKTLHQSLDVDKAVMNVQSPLHSDRSFEAATSQLEEDRESEARSSEDRIERNPVPVGSVRGSDIYEADNENPENSFIFHVNVPSSATNGVPNPQFKDHPRKKTASAITRMVSTSRKRFMKTNREKQSITDGLVGKGVRSSSYDIILATTEGTEAGSPTKENISTDNAAIGAIGGSPSYKQEKLGASRKLYSIVLRLGSCLPRGRKKERRTQQDTHIQKSKNTEEIKRTTPIKVTIPLSTGEAKTVNLQVTVSVTVAAVI